MASNDGVRYGEAVKDKMEAVVMTAPETLEIKQVPVPEPLLGEVLVKVESTMICGTDIEIIKGTHVPRWPPQFPAILGHEWAGRIVGRPCGGNQPRRLRCLPDVPYRSV